MAAARPLVLFTPLVLLTLGALESPPPWGLVWIGGALAGGAGYLANRASQKLGWLAPLGVAVWLVWMGAAAELYAWAMLGAVTSAALFGLATPVRGATVRGQTLWALIPLLALTSVFPVSGLYEETVQQAVAGIRAGSEQAFERYRQIGLSGGALESMATQIERSTEILVGVTERFLPAIVFVWCALLVGVTVLLAHRVREAVGRPLPRRAPFAFFAVPEEAVWLLVLALAGIAVQRQPLAVIGANLAACLAIGYALQGLAILRFWWVGRRQWRPGLYWVSLLFVLLFAPPVLAVGATLLGVADVWLELRRRWLEPIEAELEV